MRVKTYFRTHTPEGGQPYTMECPFTEAHASSANAVMEPGEGLNLVVAERLIARWNGMFPADYSYSLTPPTTP